MKKINIIILAFLNLIAFQSRSQNTYYTGNGVNRLSQDSVYRLIEIYQEDQPEGKFVCAEVHHKEEKKDSLILYWTYSMSTIKPKNRIIETHELYLIGKSFPNFKISSDSLTELKSFYGKPIFINFWFTACEPCIAEIDVLNKFKSTYQDEMNFIAVTFESQEKVYEFLKQKPFDFIMHTGDFKLMEKLGLDKSYPRNILLNEKGEIVRIFGGVPFTIKDGKRVIGEGEEIEKEILKVLSTEKK